LQVFWLASATKVLTALCAIKAVDQGLIDLDDNVLPYLPELEKHQV
jgi:methyl acetate hydrolase